MWELKEVANGKVSAYLFEWAKKKTQQSDIQNLNPCTRKTNLQIKYDSWFSKLHLELSQLLDTYLELSKLNCKYSKRVELDNFATIFQIKWELTGGRKLFASLGHYLLKDSFNTKKEYDILLL